MVSINLEGHKRLAKLFVLDPQICSVWSLSCHSHPAPGLLWTAETAILLQRGIVFLENQISTIFIVIGSLLGVLWPAFWILGCTLGSICGSFGPSLVLFGLPKRRKKQVQNATLNYQGSGGGQKSAPGVPGHPK